jgi:methyl-accepting chemotaxis protein
MKLRRGAGFALLVAALTVPVLGGCGGGDDESSTESWANDVCTDLNTWVTDVQSAYKSLTDKGLQADKSDVQAALGQVTKATDELANNLKGLGPPETEAGQQAKSELDQLSTTLTQQVDKAEQALDSSGGTVATVQAVGAALTTAASALESTFNNLQALDAGGELESAFKNADACKSLGNQGSS